VLAANSAFAAADSELVWVEECGHVAHLEQPEFMRDRLFEFAGVEAKVGA